MTGTVLTDLGNGIETVPADDPRLAEREALRVRLRHVANMRGLDLAHRRLYLATVAEREGKEAAESLKSAFRADWESRSGGGSGAAQKTPPGA